MVFRKLASKPRQHYNKRIRKLGIFQLIFSTVLPHLLAATRFKRNY